MAPIDVAGLGESSIDHVYVVPELPRADRSKLRISSHFSSCGGQVATAMAACAALGLRAAYVGPIGSDDNGRRVRAELEARGVDASRAIVRDAATRFAVILVDRRSGDRCVLWDRDEQLGLGPMDLGDDLFDGARVLHVDAVDEGASIEAATRARARGMMVTSDIDTMGERTAELVSAVTIPIFAENVPSQLTGHNDLERALRTLRGRHDGLLCVTLGERGSVALDGDRFHHVPAPRVHAIDTTGAGDVFRGAAIYGLLQHWAIEELLRFANTAAALSCTRSGAMAGVPTLSEVRAALL